MSWYADSSALLKLLVVEKESAALTDFIDFTIKSSVLTRVEVIRTLHKIAPEKIAEAQIIPQFKGKEMIPYIGLEDIGDLVEILA